MICHGIPDDRKLQDGDIINLDITVYLDGYHGDCSEMFVAGQVDDAGKKLLQATYDCWISACNFVAPGKDYKDIGAIIEDYVTPRGFSSVRNFCGHGIGKVRVCVEFFLLFLSSCFDEGNCACLRRLVMNTANLMDLFLLCFCCIFQTFHTNPNILHYRNSEPNGQMAAGHTCKW